MEDFYKFVIEITISISISTIVVLVLNKPLSNLLLDVCGTKERAKFWSIYSNLVFIITPILFILIFGSSGIERIEDFAFYKRAFGVALFGVFTSLVIIGLQITKSIPTNNIDNNVK